MERTSPSAAWVIGLVAILAAGGVVGLLGWNTESDSSGLLLAAAVLLACFCGVFGQKESSRVSEDVVDILLLGGLGLGNALGGEPVNHIFLIGLLGYAGFFLARHMLPSLQKSLALAHLGLAVLLGVMAVFMDKDLAMVGLLFLLATFLPLVPFHLPFLGLIRSSREFLAGVWIVVWLTAGLSRLKDLDGILPADWMGVFPVLALGGALYASLKAAGHRLPRENIGYATVILLSLLWGLMAEFSSLSHWGLPFGTAVGLLMSASLFSYALLYERYGKHNLLTLQGLGSGLPRFRGIFTFLISLIVLLPVLPVVAGFRIIPTAPPEPGYFLPFWLLLFTVWFAVSWIFTTMLHQTAFGMPRTDVPDRDLSVYELLALLLLMGSASVFGMFT
ncbi:MAG: hypothetical protein AB7P17_11850 [Nitrospirales bacterium]